MSRFCSRFNFPYTTNDLFIRTLTLTKSHIYLASKALLSASPLHFCDYQRAQNPSAFGRYCGNGPCCEKALGDSGDGRVPRGSVRSMFAVIHAPGIYPDQCAEPSKVDHCARHRKLHPELPTPGSWRRYSRGCRRKFAICNCDR